MTEGLTKLRAIVAFLGEKKQFGWWETSFLDDTGRGYLERCFPRTAAHAAFRSTSEAACRMHDAAIGKVGVFHLFRLPVEKEQALDLRLAKVSRQEITSLISSKENALSELAILAGKSGKSAPGPIQIGNEKEMTEPASLRRIAWNYLSAFQSGFQTIPYFVKNEND